MREVELAGATLGPLLETVCERSTIIMKVLVIVSSVSRLQHCKEDCCYASIFISTSRLPICSAVYSHAAAHGLSRALFDDTEDGCETGSMTASACSRETAGGYSSIMLIGRWRRSGSGIAMASGSYLASPQPNAPQ